MKINSRKGEVRERKIQARRGKVKYTVDCRDEDCNKQFLSDLHMQGHYNKVHLGKIDCKSCNNLFVCIASKMSYAGYRRY